MVVVDSWFLGVRYTLMSLAGAVRCVAGRDAHAPFVYVTTPNAQHTVLYARGGAAMTRAQDGAWLSLLDSRVLGLIGRLVFRLEMPVATGSDLAARLLDTVIAPDEPVTVIGGDAAVAANLRERYGLRALALHAPPMGFIEDPVEVDRCVAFVRAHPSRFVFLACGFPRSEMLALAMRERGGITGVGLCVGASLLFLTGQVRRAPVLWNRLGLEWLYRILQEPRRMLPRLVREQLPVLALAVRARFAAEGTRHARRPG